MIAPARSVLWRRYIRGMGAVYTPLQQQIVSQAQSIGVDPSLALAIAQQESGFNPQAKSSAGAVGLFQLMPATAASLGVNPNDPSQNITGGLTYFKQLLDQYGGDVSTALWAYNAGPGNVAKGNLPSETAAYIPAVLGYQASYADASGSAVTPTLADLTGGSGASGAATDYTPLYIGGGLLAGALVLALVA